MSDLWRSLIRTSAFVRKEVGEVIRQPWLLVALVVGPFLILALFGAGLRSFDPPVVTVFVAPPEGPVADEVAQFAESQSERLLVEGVTTDVEEPLRRLRAGELDMVVVFPAEAVETVRNDSQATIVLYHNQIDPIETQALDLFTRTAVDEVNQQVLRTFVAEGQGDAGDLQTRVAAARARVGALRTALERDDSDEADAQLAGLEGETSALSLALGGAAGLLGAAQGGAAGGDIQAVLGQIGQRVASLGQQRESGVQGPAASSASLAEVAALDEDLTRLDENLREFRSLTPQVLVEPFDGVAQRVTEVDVNLTDFYAPAAVVLLLQHMVVTFIALSLVREEQLGATDLFRIAPLTAVETLAGKYLSYLLLGGVVAAALIALLVLGLGTPMAGSWLLLVATVAALLLTSTGLGFLVALAARSDSQAVQYSMLVLLASIFFSGFLLALERFSPPVLIVSWLLPATYGMELLRDIMLRGSGGQVTLLATLAAVAVVLFVVDWLLLRRRLARL